MTAPFVRRDVAAFLAFVNAAPGPRMHELDPAAARAAYAALRGVTDPPPGELATVTDLTIPGPAGDIPARLFDAKAHREPGPALMFFHGGGFVIGNLDTHASFCAEAARVLDLPLIAVDYRLAPEHPWPAAPDDCETAARWVAGSPETLGRGVTALALCGDSAGGNLAIVTAAALRDAPAAVPVLAQLCFYPVTDASKPYSSDAEFAAGYLLTGDSMAWFDAAYRADVEHVRCSPLLGRLAGTPPTVIVTASLDPIRDQGRAYAAALAEAGVAVTFREARGNVHGFITLRKAIASSAADVAGALAAFRAVLAEAEAERIIQAEAERMVQAEAERMVEAEAERVAASAAEARAA